MGGQGDGRTIQRPRILRIPPHQGLQRCRGVARCMRPQAPNARSHHTRISSWSSMKWPTLDGGQERRGELHPAHHAARASRRRASGARHAAPVR